MGRGEYEAQKKDLEKRLGEDVFVASYNGIRSKDGSVSSYCVWPKDVPTLLPEAHEIAFVESEASKAFRVSWDSAIRIVGDCLAKDRAFDPPRWRTKRWPDEDAVAALRTAAVQ